MAVQTKERTIDGVRYSVTTFPARKGLRLKATLVKTLGAAFAELMKGLPTGSLTAGSGAGKSTVDVEFKLHHAADALAKAFTNLSEQEYEDLVMRLLETTRRDGKEITAETFDLDFAGEYLTLFRVLMFVLEVNYGSFFGKGGLGSIISLDRVSQQGTREG